jgi:hypothetical protein
MGRINFKKLSAVVFGLILMQAAYLNCSRPVRFDSQAGASKASMDGGGDGYSGKLYVVVNDSGVCPDGNPNSSQILVTGTDAYVQREDCAAITPKPVQVLVSSVDSNFLAYDLAVFREKSTLVNVPKAPTVLAAMGMASSVLSNHVCSGADCWKFENNGALSSSVDFATAADFDFTVLARADLAAGVGANLELKIDGVTAGTAVVSNSSDAEFNFSVNVSAGRHDVAVAFTNDLQDVSGDRNLYVTSINIQQVGVVNSLCLSRTSGALLALSNAQVPFLNKSLAAQTRLDASAVNYSGTASSPIKLGGGTDLCLANGAINGSFSATGAFSAIANTWGIGIYGPNFLLENYRVDNYGDCIGIWDNAAGFSIRGAYCTNINGDFVSDKNGWGGTVEDSLFDGGSWFFNDKDLNAAPAGAVATIRNNLVRLQSFDQSYWGIPGHGWFWKQDTSANAVKLNLHGNIFMAEEAALTSEELDASRVSSCKKADGSPDNTIVWLGSGAYPHPAELATGCFILSTDRNVWDQAAAAWKLRHGY